MIPSPNIGRAAFQWFVSLAPFITTVLLSLQQQLQDREFDPWQLGYVAVGALMSLVVAYANVARAGTERAESTAEVVTNRDQDDDNRVEQPEGKVPPR